MKKWLGYLRKSWLWLFIGLSVIFIAHYLLNNLHRLENILQFQLSYFFISLLITLFFLLLSSIVWRYLILLNKTENIELSLLQAFIQTVLMLLGKYLPGKIWGMMARGALLRKKGLSIIQITTITFQEQLILFHAAAIITGILLVFIFPSIWYVSIVLLTSIFINQSVQKIFINSYQLLMNFFKKNLTQVPQLLSTKNYSLMLFNYMLIWLLNSFLFLSLYLTFITDTITYEQILWLFIANISSIIIGFLAIFAPGGIGIRESVSSFILSFTMPLEQAIMLSLVFRLWLVATEFILGLLFMFFFKKMIEQELSTIRETEND